MMTVTINGFTYRIEPDESGWVWQSLTPRCPTCSEWLDVDGREDTKDAPVYSRWHDDHVVKCEHCGFESGRLREDVRA